MPTINFVGNSDYSGGTNLAIINNMLTTSLYGWGISGGVPIFAGIANTTSLPSRAMNFNFFNPDLATGTVQISDLVAQGTNSGGTLQTVVTVTGIRERVRYGTTAMVEATLASALVAYTVNMFAGDDSFLISGAVANIWGDYQSVPIAGNIRLGNDTMRISPMTLPSGSTSVVFWGDAQVSNATGQVIAGDDIIDARPSGFFVTAVPLTIYGDFQTATGNIVWGNDRLFGSSMADILYGDGPSAGASGGSDYLFGWAGADSLYGNGGNDILDGGAAADILDGGEGFDVASYLSYGGSGLIVDLLNPAGNNFDAVGDVFVSIEGLQGSNYNDTLAGDSAGNLLQGMFGDDSLVGRGGNDWLDGGGGIDVAVFTGTRANYSIVRNNDGTFTVTDRRPGSPDGIDTLTGVERLQFSDAAITLSNLVQRMNLNGLGATDLVLQGPGGEIQDWIMQSGTAVSGNTVGALGAGWTLLGSGDFNGDGTGDLLFQNGSSFVTWTMNNGVVAAGIGMGTAAGWTFAGTGDFTGDGTSDVLLFNGSQIYEWTISNGVATGGNLIGTVSAGWNVVGTGDFNGDGAMDILIQNGGQIVAWNVVNGVLTGGSVMGAASGWTVVGTGDFNRDGTTDVLLRNGSTIIDWIVQNNVATSSNVVGSAGAGWNVVGTGDYNADGTADIALQNGSNVINWQMQNGTLQTSVVVGNAGTYTVMG